MDLPIPMQVVYAGLGGTVLALFVAAATNGWSCRVFFLLALRLAIGWHFLFEGLHKIHTTLIGPSETNRPFTSEPYFKAAPTKFGQWMRTQFDDPNAVIAEKLTPVRDVSPEEFLKLSPKEQAALCPMAVAKMFEGLTSNADIANQTEQVDLKALLKDDLDKRLKTATTDADRTKFQADSDAEFQAAAAKSKNGDARVEDAKVKFARWVYGVDGRDTNVKFVSSPVSLGVPQRKAHLEWLRNELKQAEARGEAGLNGSYEIKRVGELRTDLMNAEAELAKDANAFVTELETSLNAGKPVDRGSPATSPGSLMDVRTKYFITAVGACLLLGLLTRISCVLGAGFLVLTYLTHPPFPWYAQPPMTEGNPLFINKNVIEALALLTLATFPTGRWLGLDALLARIFGCWKCCSAKA